MTMSKPTQLADQVQEDCLFPTAQLRKYRRSLLGQIAALEKGGPLPDSSRRIYAQTILSIDRLALDHGDVADCKCWFVPAESA